MYVLMLAVAMLLQDAAPRRVSGRVLDPAGAPVIAVVHRDRADGPIVATSDARGRFSIELPPASTAPAVFVFVAPGFAPESVSLAATSTSVETDVLLHAATLAEQVTVTAGRRELRGVDAPAASSVISSADLQSVAALEADDALRQTPGFTLFRRSSSRAANPTTQGVTLRGLSASGASRTLVLAGGVPLNDPFGGWVYWGRIPQAAIDRIEVVRGGMSDLYGADAVGGVIHIIPMAGSRSSARGSIEGGSLDTSRVSLFGGVHRNRVGATLAVERLSTDGASIVDQSARGPIDVPAGVRHETVLASVAYRSENGTSIEARVQGFSERRANGTPLQDNDTNQRQAAVRGSGSAFGGAWQAAGFGTSQTYDQAFSSVNATRTTESLTQRQRVPSKMTGGSADWLRAWGMATLLAGAEARRVDGRTVETRFVSNQPQAPTTAGGRQRTAAGFSQLTLAVSPALTVVGGVRVDQWTSRNLVTGVDRDRVHPTARVAATWRTSDAGSIRGTVYRAFRAPTLNELHRNFRVGDSLTQANDQLVAETLTGGEVSWLWATSRYSWRVTGFATGLDDAIANVTLSVTPTLTTRQRQNAGSVSSRGAEMEGEWRLDRRWTVTGNVTVTRATFGEGPSNLDGLRVPQVPRYQATAGVRFVDPRWLTASAQVRAIGRQFEDDRNTLPLAATRIVDLFGSRSITRNLNAFVAVENLFDEVVPTGRTPLPTIGLPRTYRVGVRVFWP
jgi:outer membrane receptor protein involved in Fe transport